MSQTPKRLVEFNKLNTAGKLVFVAGSAVEAATGLLGAAVGTLSRLWDDAERAFQEGRREDMDDARILEETNTSTDRVPPGHHSG